MNLLAKKLLSWYALNSRHLPWRDHPDPYAVWISEVMLQQTRVDTVLPYYLRWMKRFPTLSDLAEASQEEALLYWEGLGYYSRVRNLHRAAGLIVTNYGGSIPNNLSTLRKIPGIGRYTAGAIASIAFGQDVAALDGNIKRVLSRIFNVKEPVDLPTGNKKLWKLAEDYLPSGRAGDYNQALMELGALVCLPKNPRCHICPVVDQCLAKKAGFQLARPVKSSRKAIPHFIVTAAVIRKSGKVLITKRPANGLLGGLWEFPGGKCEPGEDLHQGLQREIKEELDLWIKIGGLVGVYKHAYTHYRITVHAFTCSFREGQPRAVEADALAWVYSKELANYPMGKVDRMIANQLAAKHGK